MPYRPSRIVVYLLGLPLVLLVTAWDTTCLLWGYYIRKRKMSRSFLISKLRILSKIIITMEMDTNGCPLTINFTYLPRVVIFKKKSRKTRREKRKKRKKQTLIKKTVYQYIFG